MSEPKCIICHKGGEAGAMRALITRLGTYVNATGKYIHLNCERF